MYEASQQLLQTFVFAVRRPVVSRSLLIRTGEVEGQRNGPTSVEAAKDTGMKCIGFIALQNLRARALPAPHVLGPLHRPACSAKSLTYRQPC